MTWWWLVVIACFALIYILNKLQTSPGSGNNYLWVIVAVFAFMAALFVLQPADVQARPVVTVLLSLASGMYLAVWLLLCNPVRFVHWYIDEKKLTKEIYDSVTHEIFVKLREQNPEQYTANIELVVKRDLIINLMPATLLATLWLYQISLIFSNAESISWLTVGGIFFVTHIVLSASIISKADRTLRQLQTE